MKQVPVIIFAGDKGWKISSGDSLLDVPNSTGAGPDKIAAELSAMPGVSRSTAILALPASWCLSATVSLEGIPARNRRTALLYRLELQLPLTAEDIAADYVINQEESAFAICASTAVVKPFIDAIEAALESAGVLVQSIVPASIYAVQSMIDLPKFDAVVWKTDDGLELFQLRGGAIVGWYAFPARVDDLNSHLNVLRDKKKLLVCGNPPLPTIATSLDWTAGTDRTIEQTVCANVAAGIPSTVELRRDGLAPGDGLRAIRKPLGELMAAALVLALCICAAACWRANQLEKRAGIYRSRQRELYRQAFPGHAVPSNIVSRLRNQEKILKNDGGPNRSAPGLVSALPVLRATLSGIESVPPEVRFEVDDLKAEGSRISIETILRNRADLSQFSGNLERVSHLKLDPPQTAQAIGKGFQVTLTGEATK